MKFHCPHFRTGVGLTVLLAVLGLVLGELPGLIRLGPLSVALLLGMAWRWLMHVPEHQHVGIGFSAKQLLRAGIVLLGVRLNFQLIAHSGYKILLLDVIVITFGVGFITWLGKRAGLQGQLPLLLAVGSLKRMAFLPALPSTRLPRWWRLLQPFPVRCKAQRW